MRHMVVVAEFTERIHATFQPTIRTDRETAIKALSDRSLAAWHSDIFTARDIFREKYGAKDVKKYYAAYVVLARII
jgi:hypothetical protein